MSAKILISAEIHVLTGMHIGSGNSFSAIGAVDSPVVRDPLTMLPIIPGSSLKGKMRYLLAKQMNKGVLINTPNDDKVEVKRIFGSSEKPHIKRARLKFNDCFMLNAEELIMRRVAPTEIKFENTIDRKSSIANPRQLERVVKGSIFYMELFYDTQDAKNDELIEDFKNICEAFKLLKYDYLGGHGTRGSGRVKFANIKAETVIGELSELGEINDILGKANEDAL